MRKPLQLFAFLSWQAATLCDQTLTPHVMDPGPGHVSGTAGAPVPDADAPPDIFEEARVDVMVIDKVVKPTDNQRRLEL